MAGALTAVLVLPLGWLLAQHGLMVLPLWVFVLACALLGVGSQSRYHRWLGGPGMDRRHTLRVAVSLSLTAVVNAAVGTGFLLPLSAVITGAVHIGWSSGRTWRPVAVTTGVLLVVQAALLESGVLHSPLPVATAHVLTALTAATGLQALLHVARTADQRLAALAELGTALTELRSAEAWFRALVQDSHEVLATIRPDGTLSYVSPSASTAWGTDAQALRGTDFLDLLHPEDVLEAHARFSQCLEAGGAEPVRAEVRLRVAAGEHRWM
ncbi:PAS domain S-box protein, partial [Kineococcus xinjiangensis]|uniref:PAS domain S-box protein n=1 Tax=Kineococcus xinjiangensis TaxID=512762 RepID=UPI00130494DD